MKDDDEGCDKCSDESGVLKNRRTDICDSRVAFVTGNFDFVNIVKLVSEAKNCFQEVIPSQVLRRTEAISRSMQNLLTSLKDGKQENILACSKRIIGAVRELILLFPEVQNSFTQALFKLIFIAIV